MKQNGKKIQNRPSHYLSLPLEKNHVTTFVKSIIAFNNNHQHQPQPCKQHHPQPSQISPTHTGIAITIILCAHCNCKYHQPTWPKQSISSLAPIAMANIINPHSYNKKYHQPESIINIIIPHGHHLINIDHQQLLSLSPHQE